jgi:hypothetical protein
MAGKGILVFAIFIFLRFLNVQKEISIIFSNGSESSKTFIWFVFSSAFKKKKKIPFYPFL